MLRKRSKKPLWQIEIAKERIEILLKYALNEKKTERARRYVELARKIAMKYNIRLKREQKRLFCKWCNNIYREFEYTKTRNKKFVLLKCPNCQKISKIPNVDKVKRI